MRTTKSDKRDLSALPRDNERKTQKNNPQNNCLTQQTRKQLSKHYANKYGIRRD